MKKFISMMMALALTFALAIPAFAASGSSTFSASGSRSLVSGGEYTFNMGAFTQTPTINVYVPAVADNDAKLILNPYGIEYTLHGDKFKDQVISSPIYLGSLSNVPLQVGMTVKATTNGNAALATKSLADDTKTKTNSVFLWGQVVKGPTGASVDLDAVQSGFATAYDDNEGKTGSMILVKAGEAGSTRTGLYSIPAAADATVEAKTEWACVKFFGDAVKAPTTPWADGDTVTLAITFTFTPSMGE